MPFCLFAIIGIVFYSWYLAFNYHTDKDILEKYLVKIDNMPKSIGWVLKIPLMFVLFGMLGFAFPAYMFKLIVESWKQEGWLERVLTTVFCSLMIVGFYYLVINITIED